MLECKNKLLPILFSALLISLSGCGDSDYTPPYRVEVKDSNGNSGLVTYKVDDIEIECLRKGNSMSCNWEKYNELNKAN